MKIDLLPTHSDLMNGLPSTDGLKAAGKSINADGIEQLKTVAKGFESIFINQILKQMQETIKNASFDPDDSSNEQVHSLYCTFLSDSISQSGGFGLWEKIYDQMADAAGLETASHEVVSKLDQKA